MTARRGAPGKLGSHLHPCPSPRRRGERRTGYVLVLFVTMFVCLMGLAALVIDMGFARLAQRQMQTAVDSAALEGLRGQDCLPIRPRSEQASHDGRPGCSTDEVDSSGGTVQYGAGPVVQFTGGIGPAELAAAHHVARLSAGLSTHDVGRNGRAGTQSFQRDRGRYGGGNLQPRPAQCRGGRLYAG